MSEELTKEQLDAIEHNGIKEAPLYLLESILAMARHNERGEPMDCPNCAAMREALPDPSKLRLLAIWLDVTDRPGQGDEVQTDLRRWASSIDQALSGKAGKTLLDELKKLRREQQARRKASEPSPIVIADSTKGMVRGE